MTILDDIARYKRNEVAAACNRVPESEVERRAAVASPVRGFRDALLKAGQDRYALIAEIKRASPSKGLIRADFDPAALASAYWRGGAACLSVLTDTPSFQGAPEHLVAARRSAPLPALRKDFLFEPYQVAEARAWGADCVLVIMAAVDDREAENLMAAAARWKMDVLVEIHDESELDRALALEANMIGINNRDLKTFVTELGVTERLAPRIPDDVLIVSESGIGSPEDLERLAEAGVDAFLVGESLMREHDVTNATRQLVYGRRPA